MEGQLQSREGLARYWAAYGMALKINQASLSLWALQGEHIKDVPFVLFVGTQMHGSGLQWSQEAAETLAGQQGDIFGLPGYGVFGSGIQHRDDFLLDEYTSKYE
jgi:hypothetical protein